MSEIIKEKERNEMKANKKKIKDQEDGIKKKLEGIIYQFSNKYF